MPEVTLKTKFFHFHQNNSGGRFHIDDTKGLGPNVWIEAVDYENANDRAERLGIYFNGCDDDIDCHCCGDRWHAKDSFDDGEEEVRVNQKYHFMWHDTIYVHHLNGSIERIKKST